MKQQQRQEWGNLRNSVKKYALNVPKLNSLLTQFSFNRMTAVLKVI